MIHGIGARFGAVGVALAMTSGLLVHDVAAPQNAFAAVAAANSLNCEDGLPSLDGRVFPEPSQSPGYTSFAHFVCGMLELETTYPELLESEVIGQSAGGNDQYVVRLTDETVTEAKPDLLIYSSIHGGEIGGREGAVRQIEDMVDPDYLADEDWVRQVLDEYVVHWFFPNPDGWVAGEGVGAWSRGNDNGTDLNRNYANTGYIANTPESEPESEQAADYIRARAGNWFLGTDNHGQGGDTYAAAGLQIVGQFDYQKSETLARFADGISEEMATNNGVLQGLDALNSASGADLGPYHWGTLYDMLGYSASGSMIDWFNTPGGPEGVGFATELTAGQQFNQALHPGLLNQVHVDSIRAINTTMFKQAIDPVEFTYELGGDVAYVFDPRRITDADADGRGYDGSRAGSYQEMPYDVSRMLFFEDLAKYASRPITQVRVPDVLSGAVDLSAFDSIVLANEAMPETWVRHDTTGAPIGEAPAGAGAADVLWYAALQSWVEAGGNLVVTDAAIADVLPRFGIVEPGNVYVDLEYVGAVNGFTDTSHELNADLRGVASQTYDTISIGMAFGTPDSAPNYKIDQSAFEAAGGFTAGTHSPIDATQHEASATIYGEVPLGEGRVRVLGALLPDPTEEFFHPFGLQNYAVTYTGYTLLANMLVWDNPAQIAAPEQEPTTAPTPTPEPSPLPATGGGLVLGALVLLGATARLRRR
ncbi:MAG: hypothetical protein ACI867_001406 [Glaciecola sp.]|jgi:hypothetical protein